MRTSLPLTIVRAIALTFAGASILYCGSVPAVKGKQGMSVSAHPLASAIGTDMLQRGGNSVDASVAIGFALAVVYPEAGNIGGGGFMTIRRADGKSEVIDFREKAPAASTRDMYLDSLGEMTDKSIHGHLSAGVPGSVAGLLLAHERHGVLKRSDVMEPAIKLAEQGFVLRERDAAPFQWYDQELRMFPSTRKAFLRDTAFLMEGDTLRQPELAATLRRIKDKGAEGFYSGETARLIVEEMKRGGGIMTAEDLGAYRAVVREPVRGSYRGYEIIAPPPPSSGGLCLIEALNILEGYDLAAMGFHSSRSVHVIVETLKRVYADRASLMGDDDFGPVPSAGLLSKEYADGRRNEIDSTRAAVAGSVRDGASYFEGDHTTHFSVIDSAGMVVSTTTTLNDLYGSKVVVDGAGFFLNDEMDDFSGKPGVPNVYGLPGGDANSIEPHKRPLSSMTPTIVLKDGKPVLVLGARGGPRIITAVLQVILNVIDYRMKIQEAVDMPRFHHQWLPDTIVAERYALVQDVQDRLVSMGHSIREGGSGQLEVIFIDRERGLIFGAPDPREQGAAVGY